MPLRDTRTALGAACTSIGPNDLLIAAHLVTTGATLIAANTREFRRVPGPRAGGLAGGLTRRARLAPVP